MMLDALEAECESKTGTDEFDAWLENLILMCSLKFDLEVSCGE